jgi:transposase
MAKEREILRLHFEGESQRDICAALKVGHTRVSALISATRAIGISWEAVGIMDDKDIKSLLLPDQTRESAYAQPDFKRLAKELERPSVTRKLLWSQYCSNISDERTAHYGYAQFCKLFDEYLMSSRAIMRLTHEPGKRCFYDWAGQVAVVTDDITGAEHKAYLFVACLPYSAYTFVYAFPSMEQRHWIAGHILSFEFFKGVPAILVPDNCATATDRSPIYTILINDTYREFATYYESAVVPARVRRANDKALVESAVLIAERQILAPLRNEKFFSFADLNDAIATRVAIINETPFQKRAGSRLSVFLEEECTCLKPLPPERFELAEYKVAKCSIDYHVQVDSQRYSVPYRLIGRKLEVRLTEREVKVYDGREEVAVHKRLYGQKGQYSTVREHMPASHQNYDNDWSPERFLRWAEGVGPATRWVIEYVLVTKAVAEQAFVPCMNILNLAKRGKRELLEEACTQIQTREGIPSYTAVKSTMAAIKTTKDLAGVSELFFGEQKTSDGLGDAGLTRGSDYYSIGGEDDDDDK